MALRNTGRNGDCTIVQMQTATSVDEPSELLRNPGYAGQGQPQ